MFHFGLPSEPLDFENIPGKPFKRFERLIYPGSGDDPLPLPVAKKAIYVDLHGDLENPCKFRPGVISCTSSPESILLVLIEKAKDLYNILEEPIISEFTKFIICSFKNSI